MLNWLARNEQSGDYRGPRPLTESWKVGLAAFDLNYDKRRKAWVKTKLDSADVNDPPINFETFDPGHFLIYLMACQTRNGTWLSKAGYYWKRTGLYHMYRVYGKIQSNEFQKEMSRIFKGFLRIVNEELQNGDGRISTGKVPLSFELYNKICQWMWDDQTASGRFAHLFLVLSWNLACRSSNTKTIHFHHLSWMNNSLQCYFAHMKNDQIGDRPRDPMHIYMPTHASLKFVHYLPRFLTFLSLHLVYVIQLCFPVRISTITTIGI